jgi:hypothetical protein
LPRYSDSLTTSIFMIGSSSFGRLDRCASRNARAARDLERERGRVDVVVLAVEQARLEVDDLVAGHWPRLHSVTIACSTTG